MAVEGCGGSVLFDYYYVFPPTRYFCLKFSQTEDQGWPGGCPFVRHLGGRGAEVTNSSHFNMDTQTSRIPYKRSRSRTKDTRSEKQSKQAGPTYTWWHFLIMSIFFSTKTRIYSRARLVIRSIQRFFEM